MLPSLVCCLQLKTERNLLDLRALNSAEQLNVRIVTHTESHSGPTRRRHPE
jgi:hypothetical protein